MAVTALSFVIFQPDSIRLFRWNPLANPPKPVYPNMARRG